jgi:hypothetical protein
LYLHRDLRRSAHPSDGTEHGLRVLEKDYRQRRRGCPLEKP